MDPVKENIDKAMNEIHKTWWNHVNGLAEKWANHPDPEAWHKHFLECLDSMEQGPPPKPSVAGSSGGEAQAVKRGRVDDGETSNTEAVKRRRVDDGETSDASRNVSKALKSAAGATYSFNGPAEFRVKTDGTENGVPKPTLLVAPGGATVWIEHALDVGVCEVPVVKKLSFPESNMAEAEADDYTPPSA